MDSHKAAKAVKPKRNMSLGLVSLLFLAPALVFYIAFELWPIIQTIWYSFYEWNGIDASTFIGVESPCSPTPICTDRFCTPST